MLQFQKKHDRLRTKYKTKDKKHIKYFFTKNLIRTKIRLKRQNIHTEKPCMHQKPLYYDF